MSLIDNTNTNNNTNNNYNYNKELDLYTIVDSAKLVVVSIDLTRRPREASHIDRGTTLPTHP